MNSIQTLGVVTLTAFTIGCGGNSEPDKSGLPPASDDSLNITEESNTGSTEESSKATFSNAEFGSSVFPETSKPAMPEQSFNTLKFGEPFPS